MVRPQPPVTFAPYHANSKLRRQYLDNIRTKAGPFTDEEFNGAGALANMNKLKILYVEQLP